MTSLRGAQEALWFLTENEPNRGLGGCQDRRTYISMQPRDGATRCLKSFVGPKDRRETSAEVPVLYLKNLGQSLQRERGGVKASEGRHELVSDEPGARQGGTRREQARKKKSVTDSLYCRLQTESSCWCVGLMTPAGPPSTDMARGARPERLTGFSHRKHQASRTLQKQAEASRCRTGQPAAFILLQSRCAPPALVYGGTAVHGATRTPWRSLGPHKAQHA